MRGIVQIPLQISSPLSIVLIEIKMKKLSYSKLKEKVKNANKKEFYALVIALWWIPLGSFWSMAAIWIRYSSNIKKFFHFKK